MSWVCDKHRSGLHSIHCLDCLRGEINRLKVENGKLDEKYWENDAMLDRAVRDWEEIEKKLRDDLAACRAALKGRK